MKQILLATTVLGFAVLPGTVFAQEAYSWSGFYVGGTVGGVGHEDDRDIDVWDDDYDGGILSQMVNFGEIGATGGLTAGANFQAGSFVFGVEGDYSFVNIEDSVEVYNSNDDEYGWIGTELKGLGTVRGRVGVALDRGLVFATAGVAFGKVTTWQDDDYDSENSYDDSETRTGWTAGGGVEFAVDANWTVKAEGLYYDLGTETVDYNDYGTYEDSVTGVVARVGANYKF